MAIITRWRIPPENWCGKSPRRLSRRRNADPFQQHRRPAPRRPCAQPQMRPQRLGKLVADAQHRIERGHRVLEDEPHLGAAHAPQARRVEREQVLALQQRPARDDLRRRHGQQPEQRQHGHALARAALAHHAEQLARVQIEADAVDRMHRRPYGSACAAHGHRPAARHRERVRPPASGSSRLERCLQASCTPPSLSPTFHPRPYPACFSVIAQVIGPADPSSTQVRGRCRQFQFARVLMKGARRRQHRHRCGRSSRPEADAG